MAATKYIGSKVVITGGYFMLRIGWKVLRYVVVKVSTITTAAAAAAYRSITTASIIQELPPLTPSRKRVINSSEVVIFDEYYNPEQVKADEEKMKKKASDACSKQTQERMQESDIQKTEQKKEPVDGIVTIKDEPQFIKKEIEPTFQNENVKDLPFSVLATENKKGEMCLTFQQDGANVIEIPEVQFQNFIHYMAQSKTDVEPLESFLKAMKEQVCKLSTMITITPIFSLYQTEIIFIIIVIFFKKKKKKKKEKRKKEKK